MFDEQKVFYPHRRKADGTFESICLTCLETIAHASTEDDLHEHDRKHVCRATSPRRYPPPRGMAKYKTPSTFEESDEQSASRKVSAD